MPSFGLMGSRHCLFCRESWLCFISTSTREHLWIWEILASITTLSGFAMNLQECKVEPGPQENNLLPCVLIAEVLMGTSLITDIENSTTHILWKMHLSWTPNHRLNFNYKFLYTHIVKKRSMAKALLGHRSAGISAFLWPKFSWQQAKAHCWLMPQSQSRFWKDLLIA